MEIFDEMKKRVPMAELLSSYGILPTRGRNIYKCFSHPDNKPSANIVKGCEKFHCFVCNKNWDIFDVVQELDKCDLKKASQIIDKKFNLGILGSLTHKEKLELARKRKEREQQKANKLAWEKFEHRVCNEIIRNMRMWEEIEKATHLTRGQYRSGVWECADLHFQAIKELRWLNWLYCVLCGLQHQDYEYDYIFGNQKQSILLAIKKGDIKI